MVMATVAAIALAFGAAQIVQWGLAKWRRAQLPARLRELHHTFRLPASQLHSIMGDMEAAIQKGLQKSETNECKGESFSEVKMLPAHITSLPSGDEAGHFVTVDLGGTKMRVCRVGLNGSRTLGSLELFEEVVPEEIMGASGPEALFDFVAKAIARFAKGVRAVGFTFSFPIQQTAVDTGILLEWTKGYSIPNTVGKDVVSLIKQALRKAGLQMEVPVLCNDTVSLLAASSYLYPRCRIAVIFGTGTNCCYFPEFTRNFDKSKINSDEQERAESTKSKMVVNMEWSNFNSPNFPHTEADSLVDAESPNPGLQKLEKLVSGRNLGRIVRNILLQLCKDDSLDSALAIQRKISGSPSAISTKFVSSVDDERNWAKAKRLIEEGLDINVQLSARDVAAIRETCRLVGRRAARLSAAALATVLRRLDHPPYSGENNGNAVQVAVDGTLFEKYNTFRTHFMEVTNKLVGRKVEMIMVSSGSTFGTAVLASFLKSGF